MRGKLGTWLLRALVCGETVTFIAIAVALVVIAVVVFVQGVRDLVLAPHGEPFAVTITRAVNSALFIVVVLELVRTIVARLRGEVSGFSRPGDRDHLGDPRHPHRGA